MGEIMYRCLIVALLFTACTSNTSNNSNAVVSTNTNNSNTDKDGVNIRIETPDILNREEFEKQKERVEKEAREAGSKIGAGANDLWLWTKVRTTLAATEGLRDSTSISVDVEKDAVTLNGTVNTPEQKAKAEQVVKSIDGVATVTNNLQVSGS
jgi:outer membrane biogenesis lipoprotein LolB